MNRKRIALLVIAALLMLPKPTLSQRHSDLAFLRSYDRIFLRSLNTHFRRDHRYDAVLHGVARRLQPQTRIVYPGSEKVCTYHTFSNAIGFNALATYELIVFDTILLDSIYGLTRAIVFYGTLDNPYTEALIAALRSVHPGIEADARTRSRFRPPPFPNLAEAKKRVADQLFIESVAFVMGHEGSHSFLEHHLRRIRASQDLERHPITRQQIDAFITTQLSVQHELEADRKGAELLLRSGFSTQGALLFIGFLQRLEANFGLNATHPPALLRIQAVKRVEARMRGQSNQLH